MLLDLDEEMLVTVAAATRARDERDRERDDRWGYVEELLAQVVEGVHQMTLVMVDVNGKWTSGRPEPLHIIRPGEKPRNVVSMGDMARRLSRG